jgi:hypothetical protein
MRISDEFELSNRAADSGVPESEVPMTPNPVIVPITGVRSPINTKAAVATTIKPAANSNHGMSAVAEINSSVNDRVYANGDSQKEQADARPASRECGK